VLREVTEDEIIFRNVVTTKEGVFTYEDGKWYKPAFEIKKTSENTDKTPLATGTHADWREIGYVVKPKNGRHYKQGKMIRDWHFNKSEMTDSEKEELLTGKKMDVSIGYKSDDVKLAGKFLTLPYDGVNTNIDVDHFLWTQKGKCSEPDGCGLRRSDSAENIRYDSIEIIDGETMNYEELLKEIRGDAEDAIKACVAKQSKAIAKKNPDWENKKVVKAAYSICQKNGKDEDKTKEKKTKGDSILSTPTDNNEGSTPPTDQTNLSEEYKSLMEEVKGIKAFIDTIKPEGEPTTPPTTEATPQTPPLIETIETGGAEEINKVITSINEFKTELKEELKNIKEFVQKATTKRSSTFPLKGQEE